MSRNQMLHRLGETRGYFGIGVLNPKTEANVGTLWRSAMIYRSSMIATIGRERYRHQASDTTKAPNSIPLVRFADMEDLLAHLPHGCQLVGVELSDRAVALPTFLHPQRAFYLLGAEDNGLPPRVLDMCHHVVQIPTPEAWSMNVAVAGSIVMHDRFVQRAAMLPHISPSQPLMSVSGVQA